MHGDKEQKCLEEIKIIIDSDNSDVYFGMTQKDCQDFNTAISTAKANPDRSSFPDFIFENGFIEHFQITASKTTRKGSEYQKEYSHYRKDTDEKFNSFKQLFNENNDNETKSIHSCFNQPIHSYDCLEQSFKTVWESHIESLKKYTGNKSIGIFMIDFPENALCMFEDVYSGLKENTKYGDLRKPQQFNYYRLSRDKKLLEYMHNYYNYIKYVIYKHENKCEVICLENISELLNLLPWEYKIFSLDTFNIESLYHL